MISAGALLVLLNALSAYSFHVEYGTECSTVGAACSCTFLLSFRALRRVFRDIDAFLLLLLQTSPTTLLPADQRLPPSMVSALLTSTARPRAQSAMMMIPASVSAQCLQTNRPMLRSPAIQTDYCGTDGTCGGEGAGCNTQAAFLPGQAGIACDSEACKPFIFGIPVCQD
jgi:hypothetical protein